MGYLFSGVLSHRGRRLARVFGAREEQAGEYRSHLYVDAGSLDPEVVRDILACARAVALAPEWDGPDGSCPWRAFRFDFDDGRWLEAGTHHDEPDEDGFLHFHRRGDFVGPPCRMTSARWYRLNHPSVEDAKRAEHYRPREAIPYPDPPPGSEVWAADDPRWRDVFDAFLAHERGRRG